MRRIDQSGPRSQRRADPWGDGEVSTDASASVAWFLRLFALLHCRSSSCSPRAAATTTTAAAAAARAVRPSGGEVPEGGELVIGAEQEPDCVAWIKSCGGSSWGYWMMGVTTMPRVVRHREERRRLDVAYNTTCSPASRSSTTTDPARRSSPTRSTPTAVWSDGTPITCDDFKYTWDADRQRQRHLRPDRLQRHRAVDCPDPTTAVVTFADAVLAAGSSCSAAATASPVAHPRGQGPQRRDDERLHWSGGPWIDREWTKGVEVVLVPNTKYWGTKPQARQGRSSSSRPTPPPSSRRSRPARSTTIYPQPQLDVVDQIKAGLPDAKIVVHRRTPATSRRCG